MRNYQTVVTTPGSRLLWGFHHMARRYGTNASGIYYDTMNFYIRAGGSPTTALTSADLVRTARTNGAWKRYWGVYTVPAGQTSTELNFRNISSGNTHLNVANQYDNVKFQTGASLIAKKSIDTSAADDTTANKGEIVTITVTITNWGETDASRCVFRDVLSDGLDYVAGSATITMNGVTTAAGNKATFNSTTDVLRVNFGTGAVAGTLNTNGGRLMGTRNLNPGGYTDPLASGEGETATITFQASVTGNAGYVVKNQANIKYNDHGWESYNSTDYTSYSSVTGRTVSASDPTTYVNEFTIIGSSISGRIWADQSADGVLDATEVRLSGIPVTLYAATDTGFTNPLLTVNTLANGTYTFSGLGVGTYKAAITIPSWFYVSPLANDNDAVVNGARAVVTPIDVGASASITNKDFGLVPYDPTISGRVWIDEDYDAILDTTETRVSGLTVGLYLNTDTNFTSPIRTTTTDSSGAYLFPQLNPGTYKVAALTPSGHFVTLTANDNDATAVGTRAVIGGLVIAGTGSLPDRDIGFAPFRNELSGTVWDDEDWDGLIDASENTISGLTIGLYASTDTTYSSPILTTITDDSGAYYFSGFSPGTYTVAAITPSGRYVTILGDNDATASGTRAVISGLVFGNNTIMSNEDIGFAPYKSVDGRAFYDLDYNGMMDDAIDTPYADATVTLYAASDTTFSTPALDALGNPLTTTTDPDGYYVFYNVPNAAYQAVMTTPSGYQVTIKSTSTDNDAVANGTRAVVTPIDLTGINPSLYGADFGFALNPYSLTVTKQVKGEVADPNKTFDFQVRFPSVTSPLTYTGASTIAGVPAPAGGTISNGYGVVTLKHGQSITIEAVPAGSAYSVIEVLIFSGYSVTITETNGQTISLIGSTGAGGTLNNDGSLLFTNLLSATVPTGIWMDIFPYALMAILGVGVLILSLSLARKTRRVRR